MKNILLLSALLILVGIALILLKVVIYMWFIIGGVTLGALAIGSSFVKKRK